jgi:hypothetical protein
MFTEQEAWLALVKRANELGKQGKSVRNIGVIHPRTATEGYSIIIEGYYPQTATQE